MSVMDDSSWDREAVDGLMSVIRAELVRDGTRRIWLLNPTERTVNLMRVSTWVSNQRLRGDSMGWCGGISLTRFERVSSIWPSYAYAPAQNWIHGGCWKVSAMPLGIARC